ncbi:uncharacterized protein PODANS_6_6510 [Podospora anserina S mat+]|uniref:Podospora anserina S mat+ genomic DNA chromosome 6, supercontig 2 n=1 Tax=Podospora anserina (strain S / ATCC MYA-4624 / DSM 980 / FGSC 10383) TaxID=515849 RepID=B2B3K7_PODAN|nr:uncharacterized protein PODANS_6_6510 [Podospora anserina S mat+]CAP71693.1 unnamed protein product [Podospora anserina S mat+]CDP31084.1 Putative protein of unknown function [Podospora anserina S mat+]
MFHIRRRRNVLQDNLGSTPPPNRKPTLTSSGPNSTSGPAADYELPHHDDSGAQPKRGFSQLPPEIHLIITQHLIYPDALSLKHTSRYFYQLVDTGVKLKVDWLMERRKLHLECPSNQRCDLGSDLRFCRGSVKLLMQRRREHIECESRPGLGCLIYGTETCPHARKLKTKIKRWLRGPVTLEMRWVLLVIGVALLPLIIMGWVWLMESFVWN